MLEGIDAGVKITIAPKFTHNKGTYNVEAAASKTVIFKVEQIDRIFLSIHSYSQNQKSTSNR